MSGGRRRGLIGLLALSIAMAAPPAPADQEAVELLVRAAARTEVHAVTVKGPEVVVDLGSWTGELGHPDDLLASISGALDPAWGISSVVLRVASARGLVPVDELWAPPAEIMDALRIEGGENVARWRSSPPPPRHFPPTGSCLGRRVFVSAGHGWTWFDTRWALQRSYVNGIQEDTANAESVNEYLIPMLERMGATVMSCRERGRTSTQTIVDNDAGADGLYEESGACWRDGAGPGHGGTYRVCEADPAAGSEARFLFSVDASDVHPVYARWISGSNRSSQVPVRIAHAGGEALLTVNQTAENDRWTYLGGWYFEAGETYEIALSNGGARGTFVVADAVRIGGGMGEVAPGGEVSTHPKWEEAAKYWIQYLGAPDTVYDQSYPDELASDHTARPSWAEWEGGDAYIMYHSNAFDGTARGTVTFIHRSSPSPGSAELADIVQGFVVADIRALFEPDWFDRGVRTGSYIELNVVDTMPAVLLELAFHDNPEDAAFLTDPDFRFHVSRSLARAFGAYFSPEAPPPPLPPARVRALNLGGGTVRLEWEPAPDGALPGTPVDRYRVYTSTNGRGFDNGDTATENTWIEISGLDWPANHYFLVTAENEGGESMPGETVAARASWPGTRSPLLLVGGFDRLDRWVREYENTRDFAVEHAEAIGAVAGGAYSFDFASNEAVDAGDVALGGYEAVIWFVGEESSGDESFSGGERAAIESYLTRGGAIFVSGSEIGWDLDETGDEDTRAWLAGTLHVSYVEDDAESHEATPAGSGIFSGLGTFSFDPADGAPYDADYPDVVAAGAGSVVNLEYGRGGAGAGIELDDRDARVVFWGFPFETVADPTVRARLMERILLFLVPDVPVPPEQDGDEGVEAAPDASTDPDGEGSTGRTGCGCSLVR